MRARLRAGAAAATLAVPLLLAGCAPGEHGSGTAAGHRVIASAGPDVAGGFRAASAPARAAAPVRLRIPAIGVSSTLERLHVIADGSIAAPVRWGEAGWYADGAAPGDPGPAVILGHVDSTSGPAVFYLLRDLRAGDEVLVDRADGSTVRFRVTGSRWVAKANFPTEDVYLPTLDPEIRLVTCGGAFNHATGHYVDNLIVFGVLDR